MGGSQSRSWTHTLLFPLVMSVCIYVILDLEYPRIGLIRIEAVDQLLVDVRRSMD